MNNLPDGWTTTTIGTVAADVQAGFASGEKAVSNGFKHLRMNNIGLDGQLVLDLVRTVPTALVRPQHELRNGDVLVCTTNSGVLVGKCTLFDLPGSYAFSNHLTRIRPYDGVNPSFLRWVLWSKWKSGGFTDSCKNWVNQSTIPKEAILEAEIGLPPEAEQVRIVGKVEAMLAKVGSSQKRLDRIPIGLKRFRQAVLAAACEGRLTADWRMIRRRDDADDLPGGWEATNVGDVIDDLKYGTAQKCTPEERGTPVLRIPNVTNGTIDHTNLKYAVLPQKELVTLRLVPGDILIIRSNGSVSLVGKSALVREAERGYAYAGYLIRVRPKQKAILPQFLNLVLSSPDIRLQIEIEARSTSGVNNINSEEVRQLRFLQPPLDEQQEIMRRVEEMFALADRLEARYATAHKHVDKITQSIVAKALRGELVPTEAELAKAEGRSYETAEELLMRIRGMNEDHSRAATRVVKRDGNGTGPRILKRSLRHA